MTDRPIIFSAPMVRALLDGRKTQTRRVLKPQPFPVGGPFYRPHPIVSPREWYSVSRAGMIANIQKVPYAPGDRLWVKEVCATWDGGHRDAVYRASLSDDEWQDLTHDAKAGAPWKIRSPIFMPRWASRLTLTVTDVRVQRVQEINAEDVTAEGIPFEAGALAPYEWSISRFADLWNSLHGADAWDQNPYVAAISFTVERRNIAA